MQNQECGTAKRRRPRPAGSFSLILHSAFIILHLLRGHAMDADLISALQKTPLFQDWTHECFEGLEHGQVVELSAGQRLIREGDPSDYFFVILEGELRLTKRMG